MKKIPVVFLLFIPFFGINAQAGNSSPGWTYLAGTDRGLYGINRSGVPAALWTGGGVRRILRAASSWVILGEEGILVSEDLRRWETRNEGLPFKTIKRFENGKKSFIKVIQEIKDLEIHPENPEIMVAATKDAVFLSRNSGQNWTSLGMPAYRTNGIKAVAAASLPELTVFLSHSTYGLHYIVPDTQNPQWLEVNTGLERLETTENPDEVSDITVSAAGNTVEIYAAQTFRGRIYSLDWEARAFRPVWSDGENFGTVDSLSAAGNTIRFVRDGNIMEIDRNGPRGNPPRQLSRDDLVSAVAKTAEILKTRAPEDRVNCFFVLSNPLRQGSEEVSLSELWLLGNKSRPRYAQADRKEGLYLPVNHARDASTLNSYLELMEERKLNMVVIDMKDDLGRLRFTPRNPEITKKGRVFRPVDVPALVKTMKERGIYMAARLVVFKDPELAAREGGKYAVWDAVTNKPWEGYYDSRRKKPKPEEAAENGGPAGDPRKREILPDADPEYETVRTYYDERWVDPYSEDVWEYTTALAKDLYEQGFDEIQFDYIRFPTDGVNLANARYRWQDPGMDMESAILSFLRHVRQRLDVPISIDIYGANGWYRTGARTGQEVELIAPYVDVISPMYYPSHFEQDFMAQDPAELRPYRIYHMGTQRTARIGRRQIIVRPYAQAFYLNVSYDRQYYGLDYVRRQREGVMDAGGRGLTYWNNSGRYEDIPLP